MKNPAAEDHNMLVCCMFLELGLGIVWNLNCHGFLLEPSVLEFCSNVLALLVTLCSLLRCSGSHVVDFLHGLLVTVVWALSSEGFEFQCTTCRVWECLHN